LNGPVLKVGLHVRDAMRWKRACKLEAPGRISPSRVLCVTIALRLGAIGAGSPTITPTTEDRQAFELGVRQQQAIDIFWDPRGCGVVLMRPYCKNALVALIGNLSVVPGLAQFADTGNSDFYDKKWTDANTIGFTDDQWKTNPRATWLRAAGAMYAASFVPNWDQYSMMQILTYRDLVLYAGSASPYGSLLSDQDVKAGGSGVSVDGPSRISKYFAPALGAIFTPEAEPALNVSSGISGDAQLGVYFSTALEMFESPMLFLSPQARAFLNELSARLGDAALGQQFVTASTPDAWRTALQNFQALAGTKLRSLTENKKAAFLFGLTAAQAAYNAAILRDKTARDQQIAVLQHTSAAMPASVSAKLPAVLAAKADWHSLNAAATVLTTALMEPERQAVTSN
jgi:hypothetical protein